MLRNLFVCLLQAALQRMQLDYVDLVYCHRADETVTIEETVRAMNHIINQASMPPCKHFPDAASAMTGSEGQSSCWCSAYQHLQDSLRPPRNQTKMSRPQRCPHEAEKQSYQVVASLCIIRDDAYAYEELPSIRHSVYGEGSDL